RAQRVGAHAHQVLTARLALVHRVEGGDRADLGLGEVELPGAEGDALLAHVALYRLHQVQHRQQRRTRRGVACRKLLGLLLDLGAERVGLRLLCGLLRRCGHRSTPPLTGSIEAMAAMTSATRPPSAMAGIDCRFTKLGSLTWTRSGLVPPSETRWKPSSPRGDSTAEYTCPGGTRKPSVTNLKWWMSD